MPRRAEQLTERDRRVAALSETAEIRGIVAAWGEPTDEQLRVLALLLRPGGDKR